ncbi:hypothetical protein DFJ58DRAFT_728069 [Suillus subalutaceus]|uniref:uncharacterized protein n=1 Tax=Suillus subalutaceus TaxID=48586 RepID=UPI001B886EB5|nr:uncharacterized protein DFJ58DRAFT_728069 [Suillus subalutaceus]KAG1853935.1 hypothetical protein DFJ58DRAFT_728069 [Suillus subalutaceus]
MCDNQEILSRDINSIINSMPSTRQRTRLQTAAYLLGAHKSCLMSMIKDMFPHTTKGSRRIPLNTVDKNKSMTYVDHFYAESDLPLDILDSMRAAMDLPKTYENLGWCLSTARRADPPHRLLTSQDISSAFKAARAEQTSERKKEEKKSFKRQAEEFENVKRKLCCSKHRLPGGSENASCWVDASQPNAPHYPLCTRDLQEWAKYLYNTRDPNNACITLPSTPHFHDICKTRKERTSLQHVPTELISPVIHNHVHLSSAINDMWTSSNSTLSEQQGNDPISPQPLKRTFALYMESNEETDGEPPQDIDEVLASIHSCYPAMEFLQYVATLKEHGILYLPTAAHFSSKFYAEKVDMSEGAAFTFHSCVCKAHMKEERAKARRKAKGKMKAQADNKDKENSQALE